MNDFDWRSLAIYGLFTAIALLFLSVFAQFINDNDAFVITSLLVLGATAAASVAIYLLLRWYWKQTGERIAKSGIQLSDTLQKLQAQGDAPLTLNTLWQVKDELKPLLDTVSRYGKSVLVAIMVMGLKRFWKDLSHPDFPKPRDITMLRCVIAPNLYQV